MKVHCVAPWGAEGRRGRYPLSGRHLIGNLLRNQEGRAGTAGKGVLEAQQQDRGHGGRYLRPDPRVCAGRHKTAENTVTRLLRQKPPLKMKFRQFLNKFLNGKVP